MRYTQIIHIIYIFVICVHSLYSHSVQRSRHQKKLCTPIYLQGSHKKIASKRFRCTRLRIHNEPFFFSSIPSKYLHNSGANKLCQDFSINIYIELVEGNFNWICFFESSCTVLLMTIEIKDELQHNRILGLETCLQFLSRWRAYWTRKARYFMLE